MEKKEEEPNKPGSSGKGKKTPKRSQRKTQEVRPLDIEAVINKIHQLRDDKQTAISPSSNLPTLARDSPSVQAIWKSPPEEEPHYPTPELDRSDVSTVGSSTSALSSDGAKPKKKPVRERAMNLAKSLFRIDQPSRSSLDSLSAMDQLAIESDEDETQEKATTSEVNIALKDANAKLDISKDKE